MKKVGKECWFKQSGNCEGEFNCIVSEVTSYKQRTGQVIIELTPDELIEATSTVPARFKVGIRPQTAILSAILNKSGVDLNEISISRTSVHRKRYQVLDRQGDKMRQETIETLKGKQLILHFDGKIVEQQQQEMCEGGMMVDCERIAVSVTSPQFGDNGDLPIGVVLSDSSKRSDQAYNIMSLLEYCEIYVIRSLQYVSMPLVVIQVCTIELFRFCPLH